MQLVFQVKLALIKELYYFIELFAAAIFAAARLP